MARLDPTIAASRRGRLGRPIRETSAGGGTRRVTELSTVGLMAVMLASLEELLDDVDARAPFRTSDALSGSRFEAVRFRGRRMILKYVGVDDDWIMRASGDLHCRQLRLFQSGVLSRLPASIDHAIVAVAPYRSERGHTGAAILMREVATFLIPPGSAPIDLRTHLRFLDHMAELHAAYWGWEDAFELFPLAHHYVFLTPTMAAIEQERGSTDPVPRAVAEGWARLHRLWPKTAATLTELAEDPGALAGALDAGPQTLVHGDWKLGNLGEHADGRTILLDWDRCGAGPATFDLAWYLAVNCDRLPQSKEAAIDAYRGSLQTHGVSVDGWWDSQLALTSLGAFLMLGWAKTDDPVEFRWWESRLADGLARL